MGGCPNCCNQVKRTMSRERSKRRLSVLRFQSGYVSFQVGDTISRQMHNLASLLQSPFHRSAAIQLHAELLLIPSTRALILDTLSLSLLPGTQNRDVLGSWLVAALEEGRRGGGVGLKSWEESTAWTEQEGRIDLGPQLSTLIEYLSLSVLDPPSLHDDIHPAPVSSAPPPPPPKGGKGKQSVPVTPVEPALPDEMAGERWARYRVGGLVGLAWILQQKQPLTSEMVQLLHNPALWSSLSSLPPDDDGSPAFGYGHSPVRRAAFAALGVLVELYPEEIAKEGMLQVLASEMLDSVWLEKEGTVWETAGQAVVKILTRELGSYCALTTTGHREIWDLARVRGADAGDEDDEDDDSDDDVHDSEGQTTSQSANSESSVAFERLLEFISTICPTIPHQTYPLLLVILSTLPPTLLPLEDISSAIKTFFAHLWSPVDARLLSTHALPGQPSAFQALLRDAVDCSTFLIGKAIKSEFTTTAEWLVTEQLGARVWKEGVLELGGRSAGRRTVPGVMAEQEATVFGQALARLVSQSEELSDKLLSIVEGSTISACAEGPFLPRVLHVADAVKAAVQDDGVLARLDRLVGRVAQVCAERVDKTAEIFVDIVKSGRVAPQTEESVVAIIEQWTSLTLPPTLYVSLVESLSDRARVSSAASRLLGHLDRSARFALAKSFVDAKSTLLSGDALETVAEEATLAALADGDAGATATAVACVCVPGLGTLDTILALVSTAIHDATYEILSSDRTRPVPLAAVEIFAAYAREHLDEVIASDIFSPALISLHHLVVLLPRLHGETHFVPSSASLVWESASEAMANRVWQDLAALIGDVACRVE